MTTRTVTQQGTRLKTTVRIQACPTRVCVRQLFRLAWEARCCTRSVRGCLQPAQLLVAAMALVQACRCVHAGSGAAARPLRPTLRRHHRHVFPIGKHVWCNAMIAPLPLDEAGDLREAGHGVGGVVDPAVIRAQTPIRN
jgi:hypothetical protein